MAARHRIITIITRKFLSTILTGSYSVVSFACSIRPLYAAASASRLRGLTPPFYTRVSYYHGLRQNEESLIDGCDLQHWRVAMPVPLGSLSRDEIIDSYIKTLAMVVGSEEEARMKIYSVSTRHYFEFGALVPMELSFKIKELPNVRKVYPDSYVDLKNKTYRGEPFINGQAVPYDPKYYEWMKNRRPPFNREAYEKYMMIKERLEAEERMMVNGRPRKFGRARNFKRGEMLNQNSGSPPNMLGGLRNVAPVPGQNPNYSPNYGGGYPYYLEEM